MKATDDLSPDLLYPHQREAIRLLMDSATGSDRTVIVVMPQRCGKTHMRAVLASELTRLQAPLTVADALPKSRAEIWADFKRVLDRARESLNKPVEDPWVPMACVDEADYTRKLATEAPAPASWKQQRQALDRRQRRRW